MTLSDHHGPARLVQIHVVKSDEPDPSTSLEEQEEVEEEAFSQLQATKTAEALSLFEEEEETPPRCPQLSLHRTMQVMLN